MSLHDELKERPPVEFIVAFLVALLVFGFAFAFFLLNTASAQFVRGGLHGQRATTASSFSMDLNDTGDPIAGGTFGTYSREISGCGGSANCTTLTGATNAALIDSLKAFFFGGAKQLGAGDTLFVPGTLEIDVTNEWGNFDIHNIVLASDRGVSGSKGARFYASDEPTTGEENQMFNCMTGGAEITGFRLDGTHYEKRNYYWRDNGLVQAYGIEVTAGDCEIHNNELFGWYTMAIRVAPADNVGSSIHHNYIHHNTVTGHGYGIWSHQADSATGGYNEFYGNYFNANRHHLPSSSRTDNDWKAYANIAGNIRVQEYFDRHSSGGEAGGKTRIYQNWIHDTGGYDVVWNGTSVAATDGLWYYNNWTSKADIDAAVDYQGAEPADVRSFGNHWSSSNEDPPTGVDVGTVYLLEGHNYTFDCTGATGHEPIVAHRWRIGDGDYPMLDAASGGTFLEGCSPSHTFSNAGHYRVEHFPVDSYGVLPEIGDTVGDVYVFDTSADFVLTAQVSSNTHRSGYWWCRAYVDGTQVYSADCQTFGMEWADLGVDVTSAVTPNTTANVLFTVAPQQAIATNELVVSAGTEGLQFWLDNVHLFGSDLDTGFESGEPTGSQQGTLTSGANDTPVWAPQGGLMMKSFGSRTASYPVALSDTMDIRFTVDFGPARATGFSATPDVSDNCDLAWTEASGSDSTAIYTAASATGPFSLLATVVGSTYEDPTPGTGIHYYFVRERNSNAVWSNPTAVDSCTIP